MRSSEHRWHRTYRVPLSATRTHKIWNKTFFFKSSCRQAHTHTHKIWNKTIKKKMDQQWFSSVASCRRAPSCRMLLYLDKRRQRFPVATKRHLTPQHFPYLNRVFKKKNVCIFMYHKQKSSLLTGLLAALTTVWTAASRLPSLIPLGDLNMYICSLAMTAASLADLDPTWQ